MDLTIGSPLRDALLNSVDQFNSIETFRKNILQPHIADTNIFFPLLAQTANEVFGAYCVSIWDNNVYAEDCLVHLATYPLNIKEAPGNSFTLSRTQSFTGIAIERCDTVLIDLQKDEFSGRSFQNPSFIKDHGLTQMISVPIFNGFDSVLVQFVMVLYFDGKSGAQGRANMLFDQQSKRLTVDWFNQSLNTALDYLLYRMEHDIRAETDDIVKKIAQRETGEISAPTGVNALFDGILPSLQRLTGSNHVDLYHWDPVEGRPTPERPSLSVGEDLQQSDEFNPELLHDIRRICIKDGEPLLLPDPFVVEDKNELGVRSEISLTDSIKSNWATLIVPILSSSRKPLGLLRCTNTVENHSSRSFSSFQIFAAQAFAKSMAPGIERYLRLREESTLLKVLKEVSSAIVDTQKLQTLLEQSITAIVEALHVRIGTIYLVDTNTKTGKKELVYSAGCGPNVDNLKGSRYDIGEGITGTIATGKVLKFNTSSEHRQYPGWKGKYDHLMWSADSVGADGPNTFLGVPIKSRDGVLGVLKLEKINPTTQHPEPYFTDDDVQMSLVISSFLGYAVDNARYKVAAAYQFRSLAESTVEIQKEDDESSAIETVLIALQETGVEDALLSLYDEVTRRIQASDGFGKKAEILKSLTSRPIDENDILAIVLRTNNIIFIEDSKKDSRCEQNAVKAAGLNAQFIVPLRAGDELIGTLQVLTFPDGKKVLSDDERLLIHAFAAHLAIAISRIRNIQKTADLPNKVAASSRFLTAETLSAMVVHSLGHRIGDILTRLRTDINSPENRSQRQMREIMTAWEKELTSGYTELQGALDIVRSGHDQGGNSPVELEPLIQEVVQQWIVYVHSNKGNVQIRTGASKSRCRMSALAFREIISVLLVNSVQAHAKQIEISTRNEKDVALPNNNFIVEAFCAECSDNGIGIPGGVDPEELFKPTFTTKPDKLGTGLGLYIARRLARQNGGDVVYIAPAKTSTRGGEAGAVFRLYMPVSI